MTHLQALQRCYPNISFTFDTKIAAFHSQLTLVYENEWEWLWKGNHIRHFHINDYGGAHELAVLKGITYRRRQYGF